MFEVADESQAADAQNNAEEKQQRVPLNPRNFLEGVKRCDLTDRLVLRPFGLRDS